MYHPLVIILAAFSMPAMLVLACEGECIVGITNALLGNYSDPVRKAMTTMASSIASEITPNKNYGGMPLSILNPIITEYNQRSYNYMENAVFKSYFHGKCQDPNTGIDPPGCPNPDCPVVCGTPGSICHFYSTFRYLAFNATVSLINTLTDPKSSAYQKVEKSVMAASSSNTRRRSLRFLRGSEALRDHGEERLSQNYIMAIEKRKDSIRTKLQRIFHQFRSTLLVECGGTAAGKTNNLPSCSWEDAFKQYILTFP